MSTIRDDVNRQANKLQLAAFVCFLLMAVVIIFGADRPNQSVPVLLLLPLFFLVLIVLRFHFGGVKCLVCRVNLFGLFACRKRFGKMGSEFKYCPGCGISLDQEIRPSEVGETKSKLEEVSGARRHFS